MSVYVFDLLVGYHLGGVDYALGRRNQYFEKFGLSPKYFFADFPNEREPEVYGGLGILEGSMLVPQFLLAGANFIGGYLVSKKLLELEKELSYDRIEEEKYAYRIIKNNKMVARLYFKKNSKYVKKVNYYNDSKLVLSEIYTDRLVYREYFVTEGEQYKFARLSRRVFLDENMNIKLECLINKTNEEIYIVPNEGSFSKNEFFEYFIKSFRFTSEDVIIIDRPAYLPYIRTIFENCNGARIFVFLHSGHYFKKGEDIGSVTLNFEYYNFFRWSHLIDTFMVSTNEQKDDLLIYLQEHNCSIPNIITLPICGVEEIKCTRKERKKNSIITASRITPGKRIDWVIHSVIKAHDKIPDISLDVYGDGNKQYDDYLKALVKEHHAEDYIHFKGHCDLTDVYQNYEIYLSGSVFESFGLSILETIASGTAVIGLDVKYGNRLFIEDGKNGRLLDFDIEKCEEDAYVDNLISRMSDALVETLSDEKRLEKYQQHSYEVAKRFLNDKIELQWFEFLKTIKLDAVKPNLEIKNGTNKVYNFNLGIGWASSGVEYAQSYRAAMLRSIGVDAKFVFVDMFPRDNIQHMTENIGFLDSEIMWLYTFFTNTKIAPVSYTLSQLENTFGERKYTLKKEKNTAKYVFEDGDCFYLTYLVDEDSERVHRVEMVSNGCLIRKDYYTYCRIYSEYYAPLNGSAHLYQRRFFNENGSIAYDEIIDGEKVMYQFPDKLLCSKEELVGYMVSKLNLTENDVVIIDRATMIGAPILKNASPAKIGVIIHADHFSEPSTDNNNILWNNYYEYTFSQYEHVDFYVTATDDQNQLIRQQFLKYKGIEPNVVTIPVGSLDKLKYPDNKRRPYSLITASRLASEKHVDWIIEAVVNAKSTIPELTLDIYGKGAEEARLKELIEKLECGEYVKLCGQQNLTEVYKDYEAYISGSTSEGFGLTLMEAIGSGLPIIGFDVRYGNQNFIDHERNGYKIPVHDKMDSKERVQKLTECLIQLFAEADLNGFHHHSYEKAQTYLTTEVEKRWANILKK